MSFQVTFVNGHNESSTVKFSKEDDAFRFAWNVAQDHVDGVPTKYVRVNKDGVLLEELGDPAYQQ